ncbi:MAG: Lrp/AsnC ligand binding domain-containing protein [Dictyoglomaceae bacterium]|nr:Lrp/AsnC ligand binding domain-containing protein [Dictyoglomaceae bacterium]
MKAYVLVSTEPGKAFNVKEALSKIEGVLNADLVTGPFDIIASVEASDLKTLGEVVISKIQTTEGVRKTLTCLVV